MPEGPNPVDIFLRKLRINDEAAARRVLDEASPAMRDRILKQAMSAQLSSAASALLTGIMADYVNPDPGANNWP
jgi:hypothetical protein